MFLPVVSDTGAVPPWEYLTAAAGTYQAGQLLNVSDGLLTAITADNTAKPQYLCMSDLTLTESGKLPVTRIKNDYIYETTLAGAAAGTVAGTKLKIAAGGLQAAAGAGAFEVVSLGGTDDGDIVRGRWIK